MQGHFYLYLLRLCLVMNNRNVILLCLVLVSLSCLGIKAGFYKNLKEENPVFYQILIDRFYDGDKTNNFRVDKSNPYGFHGGDIRGIYEKIGYLSELGVNAVILSPVIDNVDGYVDYNNYKHYGYHGYWPENFEQIEKHFGDYRILSRMSEGLHKSGIAYIQDIVLNHSGYKSFWEKNTVWVRSVRMGGCIENDEMKQCLFGLPDFKTERKDVRQYLIKVYKDLMKKADFDGVRIDAMKHFGSLLVGELKDELSKINPDIIFIGEYWGTAPDSNGLAVLSDYKTDFLFDFEFRDYLSGFLRGAMRPEVFVSYLNKRYETAGRSFIVFLNNHDLDGIITHFDVMNEDEEFRVLKIMALLQFVCGGSPLIYYGEENGLRVGKGIENRRDMQFTEHFKGIRNFYKTLISLKKKGALAGKFLTEYKDGLLYIKIENSSGIYVAVVNRERAERETEINGKIIRINGPDAYLLRLNKDSTEFLLPH